ncbi:MAG TPA: hypothetical protein VIZ43_08410 [Trebonia sp.]
MPQADNKVTPSQDGDAVAVYLAGIAALEQAATHGPWTLETDRSDDETADDHPWPYAIVMPEPYHVPADRSLQDFDYQYTELAEMTLATAEFLVAARSAVPRLLGAVRIALKLADDWMAVGPPPRTAEERAQRACGLLLYRDITAELLREVPAVGPEVTPEFREQVTTLMDRNDGLMRRLAGTEDVSDR